MTPDAQQPYILVECPRDQTSVILVEVHRGGIVLQFGNIDPLCTFQRERIECIFFVDAPELRNIYVNGKWNYNDLFALVNQQCGPDQRPNTLPKRETDLGLMSKARGLVN